MRYLIRSKSKRFIKKFARDTDLLYYLYEEKYFWRMLPMTKMYGFFFPLSYNKLYMVELNSKGNIKNIIKLV